MKKLAFVAALAAAGLAAAQDAATTTIEAGNKVSTEQYTLPGGTKVTVENNTRILYQETKQQKVNAPVRRVAVFLENNAGPEYSAAMAPLFAQIKAKAAGRNFEIIDFRHAVLAMRPMPEALKTAEGVTHTRRVQDLQAAMNRLQGNDAQKNLGGQGTTTDDRLLAQTSFVSLSQNLGADYLMILSVNPFDQDQNEANKITAYSGNVSYELTDFGGFAIGGDIVEVRTLERGLQNRPYTPGLLTKIATDLAKNMNDNAQTWRESSLDKSKIPVSFDATAMTMDNQPMYIQFDMLLNQVVRNDAQVPVRVNAIVEVDGVAVGNAGQTVPLAKGMHKVRIHQQGFDDVNMTINAKEGLQVNAPMRVTEGEMGRIFALQKQIHDMTLAKEANQAIAEMVRGKAEMLRNSHIRVDATNLPDVHILHPPSPNMLNVINNTNVNVVPVNTTTVIDN